VPDTTAQALLMRAVQKYGALEVAGRLQISQMTLHAFVVGMTPIPDGIVLRTVDLLASEPMPNPQDHRQPSQDSAEDP
jgi:hypothetical protein